MTELLARPARSLASCWSETQIALAFGCRLPCNDAMTNLRDWADPGMRASIELLFGSEPTPFGVVRGRTVRGPSKPSADQAIRAATRDLVHRLASELEAFATRRPRCEYVMAPYIPACPDPRCQAWFDRCHRVARRTFWPAPRHRVGRGRVGALGGTWSADLDR